MDEMVNVVYSRNKQLGLVVGDIRYMKAMYLEAVGVVVASPDGTPARRLVEQRSTVSILRIDAPVPAAAYVQMTTEDIPAKP